MQQPPGQQGQSAGQTRAQLESFTETVKAVSRSAGDEMIHHQGVRDFQDMTNLKDARDRLSQTAEITLYYR